MNKLRSKIFLGIFSVMAEIFILCTFIPFTCTALASVPAAPILTVETNGTTVILSWTSIANATGYKLFYAPYPDASYIGDYDMGAQTSLIVPLWTGASFYIAIQAYNADGNSDYSNIEYFTITTMQIDIDLPSQSTGSGSLAVRIYSPSAGYARYSDGAPVLIWGEGGFNSGSLRNNLPSAADDLIIITFLYPGGADPTSGRHSDGIYDYRGLKSIQALRDVILYASGELADSQGRTIDHVVPVSVLHNNIGLLGVSNGGNIVVAVAALYGNELASQLRYVIQWETPVSSQIATRDLGRILLHPNSPQQGDYFNPRFTTYDPMILGVDYTDLAYDPGNSLYQVFHDGNGDGQYTTVRLPRSGLPAPDLNLDGILGLNEDFPLDTYPTGPKQVYSRPVTHALEDNHVFSASWPQEIATPAEADAYWDLREAVRLYRMALTSIPDLEGMVLASVRDHVQSASTKPHIRQALEGWLQGGHWVKINPSPAYLIEADSTLATRNDLSDTAPNTAPGDWSNHTTYCIPEDIPDEIYQLAAVWQMADRVHNGRD